MYVIVSSMGGSAFTALSLNLNSCTVVLGRLDTTTIHDVQNKIPGDMTFMGNLAGVYPFGRILR